MSEIKYRLNLRGYMGELIHQDEIGYEFRAGQSVFWDNGKEYPEVEYKVKSDPVCHLMDGCLLIVSTAYLKS